MHFNSKLFHKRFDLRYTGSWVMASRDAFRHSFECFLQIGISKFRLNLEHFRACILALFLWGAAAAEINFLCVQKKKKEINSWLFYGRLGPLKEGGFPKKVGDGARWSSAWG